MFCSKVYLHQTIDCLRKMENFVFEGGGVLGYAYVGVVEELENHNILGMRFAGSSAGSLAAGLLACRITSAQLRKAMDSFDMNAMFDTSCLPFVNAYRFWYQGGWAKGKRLREWYGNLLAQLCDGNKDITFAQIEQKFGTKVVVTGTHLESKRTVYYGTDQTPDMTLLDAVDISTRYPAAFPMVRNGKGSWWDGGIGDNFPMHVFDRHADDCPRQSENGTCDQTRLPSKHCRKRIANQATVGFKFVGGASKAVQTCCKEIADGQHCTERIENVLDAFKSVAAMILELSRQVHVHEEDWKRTVRIDVADISAMDFHLSDDEKQLLIDNARNATRKFITKTFSDPAKKNSSLSN